MKDVWDLVVIGGGAAGFFGAIWCAERARELGKNPRVLIVEKSGRTLQKVSISGGGRCNVTHDCLDPKRMARFYPRGHRALIGPLHHFGVADTLAWFEARGVRLKSEADGRIFPTTDDSKTVVACLQRAAKRAGVEVRTRVFVTDLVHHNTEPGTLNPLGFEGFELVLRSGDRLAARQVLLTTGGTRQGGGDHLARQLGHNPVDPVPSLFTFHIDDARIDGLSGLSVEYAEVEVVEKAGGEALKNDGPLLITHWGLSGPAVLKLSAWGARGLHALDYSFTLRVNWVPGEEPAARFHQLRSEWGKRQISTHSPFEALPKRLWERLVEAAKIPGYSRWAELSKAQGLKLEEQLIRGEFSVRGKSTNKDEFVTCGGVPTDEVDMRTMESRHTAGAFFAGELLNIDGVTGGFNFQSAWTTGYLAGVAIAERI